jgi:hypothetical protein
MSVVLRCSKCSAALTETIADGNTKLTCPNCGDYVGHQTAPTTHEQRVESLLAEILAALK